MQQSDQLSFGRQPTMMMRECCTAVGAAEASPNGMGGVGQTWNLGSGLRELSFGSSYPAANALAAALLLFRLLGLGLRLARLLLRARADVDAIEKAVSVGPASTSSVATSALDAAPT